MLVYGGLSGTAAQQLFQYDNVSTEWLSYDPFTYIWNYFCSLFPHSEREKKRYLAFGNKKSDAIKMILFGLFGMLAVQYTYFASIKEGNAAVATLLQYLAPIFITVYLLFKWNVRPSKN